MVIWVFFVLIVVLHVIPLVVTGRTGIKESGAELAKFHAEQLLDKKWYLQGKLMKLNPDRLEVRVSSVALVDGVREWHTVHFRSGSANFAQVIHLPKLSVVIFTMHDPRCPEQANDPGDYLYVHESSLGPIAQ